MNQHIKKPYGRCQDCGHYGDDCRGRVLIGSVSFDGFGINGPDEYKSRLATLTDAGKAAHIGERLARAYNAYEYLKQLLIDRGFTNRRLEALISKAEGK